MGAVPWFVGVRSVEGGVRVLPLFNRGVFFHISCYEVWDTHTFMNDGFYCIFRVHCDSENTLMSIFKGR